MKPFVVLAGLALCVGGCTPPSSSPSAGAGSGGDVPKFPWKGATPSNGRFEEVVVDKASRRRVWLYPPIKGKNARGLIVIAAAGSNMVTGMALSEGDIPEHLPWTRAGYAVAAYDVSGPMPDDGNAGRVQVAIETFLSREAGVSDGRDAIEAGVKRFPEAAENIVAVGHSSAGTIALSLAAEDKRVKRCIAFAPVTDVIAHIGPDRSRALSRLSNLQEIILRNSPSSLEAKLQKPVFLFSAQDDQTVSNASVMAFAQRIKAAGAASTFVSVPSGGHYDSMLQQGVPQAIAWLNKQE